MSETQPKTMLEFVQWAKAKGLSEEEMTQAYDRQLRLEAREKGVPIAGQFELTPLCNLSCKMCYVHLSPAQMSDKRLLSAQQWKKIISDAYDAGMTSASLTGGECLIYPYFDEVYLHLRALGVKTSVMTNGLLLNEQRIAFFQKHPPSVIQVSLYGTNDDEYEQVTTIRCFEKVFKNITDAKKAGLNLSIAVTPNQFMRDGAKNLVKFLENQGLYYTVNISLFTPHENTGRAHDAIDLGVDEYIELYKYRTKLKGKELHPVDGNTLPPTGGGCEDVKCGIDCNAGRVAFHICWDGAMLPCSRLADIAAYPLITGFVPAWRKIHEAACNYHIPIECEGCAYKPICAACVGSHAVDAPVGHASPLHCQRTKKLVEIGLLSFPKAKLSNTRTNLKEKHDEKDVFIPSC